MGKNNYILHYSPDEVSLTQWKTLLSAATGNFFQTPEAFMFFKDLGLETFFLALESEKELKTLVFGVIQKEGENVKSIFTRRAIINGGPLLKENILPVDINFFLSALKEYLKKKAIYIEIRNLNNYSTVTESFTEGGFNYHPHLNFHINCTDEIAIKNNISKSKLRQIKKSLKSGAQIIEASTLKEVKEFYTILRSLYRTKIKTPLFPEEFFINFYTHNIGKYLLINFNGKVVGGIMCPVFQDRVIYEWFVCGEDGKYKGVYPSILATWAAIQFANKHGIKRFDFMGAGSSGKDYGVREFKSKFGGELVEYGRFIYVCQPLLYQIGKIGVKLYQIFK